MINERLFESALGSAHELAGLLRKTRKRIVFAESCTAGLVSAVMATIPGISDWHCGSAATYRESVKQDWLEIDPSLIRRHTAVSGEVTRAMAIAVLTSTTEADYSAAVTGHLQTSENELGSIAFVSVGYRQSDRICSSAAEQISLMAESRIERQWEAAGAVIRLTTDQIKRFETSANQKTEVNTHPGERT